MNTMFHKPISRRKFLKAAVVSLGAVALAGGSLGCAGQTTTSDASQVEGEKNEIETPSFVYGNDTMTNGRILIAYATRTGSTVGVASTIGETLSERGFAVDVQPLKDVQSIDDYQTVVIGSAVNGAQWLPEAVQFVKDHQQALNRVPVALFSVHIMNLGSDEKSTSNRLAYLNAVRPMLHPVDEGYFAGIGMNPDEQSGLVRWVYRTFKIGPEGDCRDWEKIRGWGQTISL